jgi:hypothetical protein
MATYKFPKTPHLAALGTGVTRDDLVMDAVEAGAFLSHPRLVIGAYKQTPCLVTLMPCTSVAIASSGVVQRDRNYQAVVGSCCCSSFGAAAAVVPVPVPVEPCPSPDNACNKRQ